MVSFMTMEWIRQDVTPLQAWLEEVYEFAIKLFELGLQLKGREQDGWESHCYSWEAPLLPAA